MCPYGTFPHTVRYRESLWIIARNYGVTIESIMAVNPGINPQNLRIGQVLCIPRATTYFG